MALLYISGSIPVHFPVNSSSFRSISCSILVTSNGLLLSSEHFRFIYSLVRCISGHFRFISSTKHFEWPSAIFETLPVHFRSLTVYFRFIYFTEHFVWSSVIFGTLRMTCQKIQSNFHKIPISIHQIVPKIQPSLGLIVRSNSERHFSIRSIVDITTTA